MKGKRTAITITVIMLCLILLAGGAVLILFLGQNKSSEAEIATKTVSTETFAAWTDVEEFSTVPAMQGEYIDIGDAEDYGGGSYLINVEGATTEEYLAYLETLEAAGFVKHSDNGEDAMEGNAMTASFTKDNLTVTVSHAIKLNKTYITAAYDQQLSDHLVYSDKYLEGIKEGAQTKYHMVQVAVHGCSFITQLKNGHFVIEDGGRPMDAPYLLDYLESLTPDGEKPVIEAWFISHAHGDHFGALFEIMENQKYIDRIYLNGIYYTEPPQEYTLYSEGDAIERYEWMISVASSVFTAEDGGKCGYFRPQFGQRYYFCDTYIDVCLTPEQFSLDTYWSKDYNDTSIWLMHNIEGQKVLFSGDTYRTGMRVATEMFDSDYFDMDAMCVFHHGINVIDYFTDFITVKTLLYPSWRNGSYWSLETNANLDHTAENDYLKQSAAEAYNPMDGSIVMTFPYKVGEAEQIESFDWKHDGYVRRTDMSMN